MWKLQHWASMHLTSLILLISFLGLESLCRIDVTDLIDSVDIYKKKLHSNQKKKKARREKSLLKSYKNDSSHEDVIISNHVLPQVNWTDESLKSSSSFKNSRLDNLPVLEASKKYGLPLVIDKCVVRGDIALTFDDGVSYVTQKVLDILRQEDIKATFFILGNTLDSTVLGETFAKKILKQMIADGHVVASHSYSHPNFDGYWPEGIRYEMNRSNELFQKHIGKSPRFMRPPFGNVTPQTIKALHDLGYFIIRWNVDTNDWIHKEAPSTLLKEFSSKLPDQQRIDSIKLQKCGLTDLGVRTIINGILDSKIALMHDIHPGIISFLPQLIQHTKNLGYRFVSMQECLGGINPYFE